jgi:hypothetical protein
MTYSEMHSYHWYSYNFNQQVVNTGTDTWDWECPTCNYLETSLGYNEAHWDFGVCGRCNNIGPAYFESPYAAIQSHPLKMVTWRCPNQYCSGPNGKWRNVQKIARTVYRLCRLVLSGWLITMHPKCLAMCLPSRVLQRLKMKNG